MGKVKLPKKRKSVFNDLDSWIILLGTSYEQRVDLMIKDKESKKLFDYLIELKQRRNGTWKA